MPYYYHVDLRSHSHEAHSGGVVDIPVSCYADYMTVDETPPMNSSPWWARLGVRCGLVLPRFLRRRMGIYRWHEVLSASPANLIDAAAYEAGNGIPPVRPNIHKAVQKLVAAGIGFPPSRAPWPHAMEQGACSWNRDVVWAYSDDEFDAWMKVWRNHSHREKYVNKALAVACANANVYAVSTLLCAGGNPSVDNSRQGVALDRLFSSSSIDNVIVCLSHLAPTQSRWNWTTPDFYHQNWSVAQLSKIEEQGILLPFSWQIIWAESAFRDPPFSGPDQTIVKDAAQVMQWWWSDDRLGSIEGARSHLLNTWLSSIRPGTSYEYQEEVLYYWDALISSNDLIPAEPRDGSGKSWAHRWASSIFPAAVPLSIVEAFLALPSFVAGAKDASGFTVEELFENRVQSQLRVPEDPEDQLAYQRAIALLQSRHLFQTTQQREGGVAPCEVAQVSRPTRRL